MVDNKDLTQLNYISSVTKTLVIQIIPDNNTIEILDRLGKDSAKWMNKVFRRLYADKRNHKGRDYGPDKIYLSNNGKSQTTVHKLKQDGNWRFDGWQSLYPSFIRNDAPNRIPSKLKNGFLQLLSKRVGTSWGNFLNPTLPKPRNGLIRFTPVTIFNMSGKFMKFYDNKFTFSLTNPYAKEKLVISTIESNDDKYKVRVKLIEEVVKYKRKIYDVEIKKHSDNKWYIHIPVELQVPVALENPSIVMGVDVGIRNTMTTAIISMSGEIPDESLRIPGGPIFNRLERIQKRVRKLTSKTDRNIGKYKDALDRVKGKRIRIQETMTRQAAVKVIKLAVENNVEGIAIEDLKGLKPNMSKTMNRLISNWARGKGRGFMELKAKEYGLNSIAVYARGTSHTCPFCLCKDKKNRPSQSVFNCIDCGFSRNADEVGAINIAQRGWMYWNTDNPYRNILRSTDALPEEGIRAGTKVSGNTNGGGSPHSSHKRVDEPGSSTSNGALVQVANSNVGGLHSTETKTIGFWKTNNVNHNTALGSAEPEGVERKLETKILPIPGDNLGNEKIYKGEESRSEVMAGLPRGARLREKEGNPSNERMNPIRNQEALDL